jgi:hypothetical protein
MTIMIIIIKTTTKISSSVGQEMWGLQGRGTDEKGGREMEAARGQ